MAWSQVRSNVSHCEIPDYSSWVNAKEPLIFSKTEQCRRKLEEYERDIDRWIDTYGSLTAWINIVEHELWFTGDAKDPENGKRDRLDTSSFPVKGVEFHD